MEYEIPSHGGEASLRDGTDTQGRERSPQDRTFAELLIDCELDRVFRAVLVGMCGTPTTRGEGGSSNRFSQRDFWPKHTDAMTQEDPGWRPSLRGLRYAIPIVGQVMSARARRKETNGLIGLRSTFLGLLVSLFLFLFAMSFITPWDYGDERWVPSAVAAVGVFVLAEMAWVRRRPLVTGSLEALAGSYRASFFLGVGFAESAALIGFVGVFIGGSLWIYLVGLAFALVGFWMIVPTRQDIERKQREITAAGSPLSLLDALTTVPTP